MIRLFKNLISRLVSKKKDYSYVTEAVNFLNQFPKGYFSGDNFDSLYVGDIDYLEDKNGKIYFKDPHNQTYYCDYDVKNPSKEVLSLMIDETTFTQEELGKN